MRIVLLILIALGSASAIFGLTAPKGWRFPDQCDIKRQWKAYVKEKKTVPFRVAADFNGDRFQDEAWILISTERQDGLGLFVFFGSEKGLGEAVLVEQSGIAPQAMHVRVLRQGNYRTACSYGYWDCSEEEPELLRLKTSGIVYAMIGESTAVTYWSAKHRKFNIASLTH
jgi:hypothetical protein